MKKKKSKRDNAKYPSFKPSLNLKTRLEEINDIDYVAKLNDKEKEWLNNFNEEWINASLNHKGKKFHRSKKDRKIIYDKNNARNRDSFTKAKATGTLNYIDEDKTMSDGAENPQDRMILEYDMKHNGVNRETILSGDYNKKK